MYAKDCVQDPRVCPLVPHKEIIKQTVGRVNLNVDGQNCMYDKALVSMEKIKLK